MPHTYWLKGFVFKRVLNVPRLLLEGTSLGRSPLMTPWPKGVLTGSLEQKEGRNNRHSSEEPSGFNAVTFIYRPTNKPLTIYHLLFMDFWQIWGLIHKSFICSLSDVSNNFSQSHKHKWKGMIECDDTALHLRSVQLSGLLHHNGHYATHYTKYSWGLISRMATTMFKAKGVK